MARCKFEKLAHLLPFGMLSEREKTALEAHIVKCENCAEIARDVKRIGLMYKTQPAAQPLPGFERRIAQSINQAAGAGQPGFDWLSFLGFNKAMFPVAAGLALSMAIFMFTSLGNIFATKSGAAAPAAQEYKAARGSDYAGGLSDSESALLSGDSGAALAVYYKKISNM